MGTLGGMPLELQVGDRVQSRDNHRATVMYVGSVAGATPEEGWVGLQVRVLRFLRVWSHLKVRRHACAPRLAALVGVHACSRLRLPVHLR